MASSATICPAGGGLSAGSDSTSTTAWPCTAAVHVLPLLQLLFGCLWVAFGAADALVLVHVAVVFICLPGSTFSVGGSFSRLVAIVRHTGIGRPRVAIVAAICSTARRRSGVIHCSREEIITGTSVSMGSLISVYQCIHAIQHGICGISIPTWTSTWSVGIPSACAWCRIDSSPMRRQDLGISSVVTGLKEIASRVGVADRCPSLALGPWCLRSSPATGDGDGEDFSRSACAIPPLHSTRVWGVCRLVLRGDLDPKMAPTQTKLI